jgi:hypothetical protein
MKCYIVLEFIDYIVPEIVAVFAKEEDAKNYVQTRYWKDEDGGDGIYYEEYEIK